MSTCAEMISLEEARDLVVGSVGMMPVETVPVLEALGRVAAEDLKSDIDISPFAHSAMDGFALRSSEIVGASKEAPVALRVIDEVAAGDVFEGAIGEGECVRIMTGAPLPEDADTVVKYEIVDIVEGDGRRGSEVSFAAPSEPGANIRAAGEEAKAGEVVVTAGEVIGAAGVGFLASCGVLEVPVHARPRVGIIAIGSELVSPDAMPGPGKIRNSNSYAMAACAKGAGCIPTILPIVEDSQEALSAAVMAAADEFDFVITSGGASNGDYDFIKGVVEEAGELLMVSVNMRPGKAQTFGIVHGTPVFGLPGNPAAAYCGFEMIIRPALRKMQGYSCLECPTVMAKLSKPMKKKDPRRIFLRSTLTREESGDLAVMPAKNQSSGLFGVIQKSNCLAVMPEGTTPIGEGEDIECILLDVDEEVVL